MENYLVSLRYWLSSVSWFTFFYQIPLTPQLKVLLGGAHAPAIRNNFFISFIFVYEKNIYKYLALPWSADCVCIVSHQFSMTRRSSLLSSMIMSREVTGLLALLKTIALTWTIHLIQNLNASTGYRISEDIRIQGIRRYLQDIGDLNVSTGYRISKDIYRIQGIWIWRYLQDTGDLKVSTR